MPASRQIQDSKVPLAPFPDQVYDVTLFECGPHVKLDRAYLYITVLCFHISILRSVSNMKLYA